LTSVTNASVYSTGNTVYYSRNRGIESPTSDVGGSYDGSITSGSTAYLSGVYYFAVDQSVSSRTARNENRATLTVNPLSASATGLNRLSIVRPDHLRRWQAAKADADNTLVTVNVVGDSLTVGVGSDGSGTTTLPTNDSTYRTKGYVAHLRNLDGRRVRSDRRGVHLERA
jgi:hypothetical protein